MLYTNRVYFCSHQTIIAKYISKVYGLVNWLMIKLKNPITSNVISQAPKDLLCFDIFSRLYLYKKEFFLHTLFSKTLEELKELENEGFSCIFALLPPNGEPQNYLFQICTDRVDDDYRSQMMGYRYR